MSLGRGALIAAAFVITLSTSLSAFATNGMFLIGYGNKSRAMGGTGIANPQDAFASVANPAAITQLKTRIDIGADYFRPQAKGELGGFSQSSVRDQFIMPGGGAVYKFNRDLSLGFAAVPAGGGSTRYNQNLYNNLTGSALDDTLGVNLMILQMNPTVAYRITKTQSLGVSAVLSLQTFRAYGLEYFSNFTSTGLLTDSLTNNGNDWSVGAGARAGWFGTFFKKRLNLGLVGTTRIKNGRFSKYKDLFARNGNLDHPGNVAAGMGLKITPKITLAFDFQRVFYSKVNAIGNTTAQPSGSPFPESQEKNALGRKDGLGFEWDDQNVYKLGVDYQYTKKWNLRAGYNYGKSPIDEGSGGVLFSLLAPATVEHHTTLGFSYNPNKNMEWTFSWVHALKKEQSGPTQIGGTGKLQMYQDAVGATFGYKL